MRAGSIAAGGLAAVLAAFAARRLAFICAALAADGERPGDAVDATVAVIVPAHDEAGVLERTLTALDGQRGVKFEVVLVSDGSTDGTTAIIERWAAARPNWRAVALDQRVGKSAALNAGVAHSDGHQLIAVCDADVEAEPDALSELVAALGDRRVGAASALLLPSNPDESLVTRYCALELWQHQLVTSRAKDRLGLNPPAHGWFSCYRREALKEAGGFVDGSLGEDVRATVALAEAGWRTRFVASARVHSRVPRSVPDYWRQHVRWSRGLHEAAPGGWGLANLSRAQRLEAWLHAAGYLDRVALVGAAGAVAAKRLPAAVPAAYVLLLGAEALTTLVQAGRARQAGRYLVAGAAMFAVDVAASAAGSSRELLRGQRNWGDQSRWAELSAAEPPAAAC
jgi:GT2 family glycosyltransferase